MVWGKRHEITAEFIAVQSETVRVLDRLADVGGIPGFADLDKLRQLVAIAEPVHFDSKGTLRLTTASGLHTSPKIIMAKPGDPGKHKIKHKNPKLATYGKILDRSRNLSNVHSQAFIKSTVLHDATVVPIVITLKPKPKAVQASNLAHETTHWMDHSEGMDDTALEEKRAHFVSYYYNRMAGSELCLPPEIALERALEQLATNGSFKGIVTSSLVALSTAENGHLDLGIISDTERDLFHRVGAY